MNLMEGYAAVVYFVSLILLGIALIKLLGGKAVTLPPDGTLSLGATKEEAAKPEQKTKIKAKNESKEDQAKFDPKTKAKNEAEDDSEVGKAIKKAIEDAADEAFEKAVKKAAAFKRRVKPKAGTKIVSVSEAKLDGKLVPVELVQPVERRDQIGVVAFAIIAQR